MHRVCCVLLFLAASVLPASAQSLYIPDGYRAVEVSAGWSTGPFSKGIETHAGVSLDGRWDVGVGIARYTYTFDDGFESTFSEFSPFARYFVLKQADGGPPVSLAVHGQLFVDDYSTDDSGKYVQVGTTVYRNLKLTERFALQPFVGFAFVAESYRFGDGQAERAQYLTRDLGLHFTTAVDRPWILRATLAEQSFRRETYRGARVSAIRRF
jgi:hypothetical protein